MRREADAPEAALRELAAAGLLRRRRTVAGYPEDSKLTHVVVDGQQLVNFCSNDYLGLAREPRVSAAFARGAAQWGSGAGAAHLVTGHTGAHHALEEQLADFTGREAALLFSTGYMANLGAITALAARGEVVLQDRLNHASLLDGARLAGARLQRYAHADADDAAHRLGAAQGAVTMLATDGVFSMDGDVAPVAKLAALAAEASAWLLVDDAHGLGVSGPGGRGSVIAAGLTSREVPLLMGTLGKALGCFGAFVAGDRALIDLLLQRARSYVYTTALPPAVAVAASAALQIAQSESFRREQLATLISRFRKGAQQLGIPLGDSTTPIQPLPMGSAARAVSASAALGERGFWVAAIRAPTVPAGTDRLRVTLTAAHELHEVDALLDALAAVMAEHP